MNLQNQNPEKNTNTKVQPPYPNRPIQIDEKEIEKEFQAEEGKKAVKSG